MPLETLEQGPKVQGLTIENPRRQPKWFDVEKEFDAGMWGGYENAMKAVLKGNFPISQFVTGLMAKLKQLSPGDFESRMMSFPANVRHKYADILKQEERGIWGPLGAEREPSLVASCANAITVLDEKWDFHNDPDAMSLHFHEMKIILSRQAEEALISLDEWNIGTLVQYAVDFKTLYSGKFNEIGIDEGDWQKIIAKLRDPLWFRDDPYHAIRAFAQLKIILGKDPLPPDEMLQLVQKGREEAQRIMRETPSSKAPFQAFEIYLYLKIISASRIEIPPQGGLIIGPTMQDEANPTENEPLPEALKF